MVLWQKNSNTLTIYEEQLSLRQEVQKKTILYMQEQTHLDRQTHSVFVYTIPYKDQCWGSSFQTSLNHMQTENVRYIN